MQNNTYRLLTEKFNISKDVLDLINKSEDLVSDLFENLDDIMAYNQYKVLDAFQKNGIRDMHFSWNTGYGYDDAGRDATERVFADIFNTEAALVRPIIVNGTHALTLTLMGILRPGDKLIYCTGAPYDTLEEVIGIRGKGKGSLKEYGVSYDQVELTCDGSIDFDALREAIDDDTKMVTLQRATGYGWRKAISIEEIEKWVEFVKSINPNIICMVDNCYGEFLHTKEPTDVGADLIVGSLIKNPGGGLAPIGGYIAGKKEYVDNAAYRLTSPGLGKEVGASLGVIQSFYQGLFQAPTVVSGALKGAIFAANIFEKIGFPVIPDSTESRHDIIQAVTFGSPEGVIAFCQGIQAAAPVDSYVTPEPWDMPGYDSQVIMAAGAFVQGSSIELSADGPIKPPYAVYFQGGLTWYHAKLGIMMALQKLVDAGIVSTDFQVQNVTDL